MLFTIIFYLNFVISLGSAHGGRNAPSFSLDATVNLRKGVNDISLLSGMVGLPVILIPNSLIFFFFFNVFFVMIIRNLKLGLS